MKKNSLFLVLAASTCLIKANATHVGLFADIKKEATGEKHAFLSSAEEKWNQIIEWLEGATKHVHTVKAAHGPAVLHDHTAEKADKELHVPGVKFDAYKKAADDAKDTAEDSLNRTHKLAKELHDHLKADAEKVQEQLKTVTTEHQKVTTALSKAKKDLPKADFKKDSKKQEPKKELKKKSDKDKPAKKDKKK